MRDNRNISHEKLIYLYDLMVTIRRVETKIMEHYHEDEMKTPVHLCNGQEAVAAGVCGALEKKDFVLSNHRGHGHYLAKGGNLEAMAAELYNRETGCSRGRGGSMHLIDTSVGLLGSSSIVGGGVPLAVGAALGSVLGKDDRVAVAFLGDAAMEEGVVYESLNFAVLKKLPVIFVCENNLYSVCTPLKQRQPPVEIYKRAAVFELPACRIDGNDVLEVFRVTREMVQEARRGRGPAFIECLTYRWCHHHNVTTGVELAYRTREELEEWMEKCPVRRFEKFLLQKGILTVEKMDEIKRYIEQKVDKAFAYGKYSPFPDEASLFDGLYS